MVKAVDDSKKSQNGTTFSKFTWEDGGEYEGEWLNGKLHLLLNLDTNQLTRTNRENARSRYDAVNAFV
jgi:hypothetical protein